MIERKVGKHPNLAAPYGSAQTAEVKTVATLIEDREIQDQYRVEAEDNDGGMEVAIFAGPGALDRAIFFAGNYYDGWNDPHGLAGY